MGVGIVELLSKRNVLLMAGFKLCWLGKEANLNKKNDSKGSSGGSISDKGSYRRREQ